MPMDKKLTNIQYTYIPEYVFKAFSIARVQNEGEWRPVVQTTKYVYVAKEESKIGPVLTPALVFWLFWLLTIIISVIAKIKRISLRWFDLIFFLLVGLLGLLLLLLWVATDHAAAAWNLNLLWAWPTHLLIAFWLVKKAKPRWLNRYLLFTAILGISLVILWLVVPQALNVALIPIVLILVTRASVALLE
jgi:hypothetical protein